MTIDAAISRCSVAWPPAETTRWKFAKPSDRVYFAGVFR